MTDAFEEQWHKIINRAKAAKCDYEAAVLDDVGSKKAAVEMYAANSAVRRFCEAERQIKGLQQTLGA